jgi:integrase/recombinase XerD
MLHRVKIGPQAMSAQCPDYPRKRPSRQRMIDDMTFRNMSPSTHKVYTYAVANFSAFHGRSPDKLGIEDVREYRLHLIARGLKANSINPIIGALRF